MESSEQKVTRVVHLVDPRISFAAERTLLAWIRTSLALMGVGALLREIVPDSTKKGGSLWLGIALVVLGVVSLLVAIGQHYRVIARLRRGETAFEAEVSPGISIALFLVLVGAAATAYMILVK